jgi:hypothetical protein
VAAHTASSDTAPSDAGNGGTDSSAERAGAGSVLSVVVTGTVPVAAHVGLCAAHSSVGSAAAPAVAITSV